MKKQLFTLFSLSLLLTACDQNTRTPTTMDNTARNHRDASGQTLTPGDQSENEMDRAITQRIRQALMQDDSLSTNAKNVKVITIDGVTTLRGVVNNEREKNEIARKTRSVSGVRNVNNLLEIVRSENAA